MFHGNSTAFEAQTHSLKLIKSHNLIHIIYTEKKRERNTWVPCQTWNGVVWNQNHDRLVATLRETTGGAATNG